MLLCAFGKYNTAFLLFTLMCGFGENDPAFLLFTSMCGFGRHDMAFCCSRCCRRNAPTSGFFQPASIHRHVRDGSGATWSVSDGAAAHNSH